MKNALVLVRSCPYGMASAAEGFRAVSALAGLGMDTTAVLLDDGILVAVKGQDPSAVAMSSLEKAYATLPEFGAKVMAHRGSAEARAVPLESLMSFPLVDDDGLRSLLDQADVVLTF